MSPKLKRNIRFLFIAANIITVVFLLLACLVPFLNAGKHTFIALLGLVFPLLFLMVLCFFIYWLIRRSKWALLSVVALLLSWQQVWVVFNWGFSKTFNVDKSPSTLRVFTWNLSAWGVTAKGKNKNNTASMVDLIKSTNADVLCLEEFLYYNDEQYQDTIIPALKAMGYQYVYFAKKEYTGTFFKELHLTGTEIMSKYPIINTATFIYNEEAVTEPLIYADIKVNDKTIRVFTTHLESVRFGDDDYEALHNFKNPVKINIRETRNAGGKLKRAYRKRALQAEFLHDKIIESPYPVIVCGDFNDVPSSFTYFTVKGNLQDAFLKKGAGFGRTFRFISPTLRIDYILADKKFDVTQYHVFDDVKYSDHYPVVADFDELP
ncbi:MAG: endonuclease/exonuclease/phosphatase family protein [Ferruginibacter sp.]